LPTTGQRRFIAGLVLILHAGCGRSVRHQDPPSLDGLVRDYLRMAVALGERDPDALDYYYGPAEWVADVRTHPPSLAQIKTQTLEISHRLEQLALPTAENGRRTFLLAQLRAVASRCNLLLGVTRSFDQESWLLFGIHPKPAPAAGRAAVGAQLRGQLPGRGDLADRYAAYDQRYLIPPERLPAVLERAMQVCRERTLAHWRLPIREKVTLEYVHDKPWSAYSTYHGNYRSTIHVNIDLGLTIDRALQLACHEGYPGHHVFNSLTEELRVRGENRLEFMVQPTFSPQSLVSESAASAAPGLALSEPDRLHVDRDMLIPLAAISPADMERYLTVERLVDSLHPAELSVARDYLDGRLEFARAAEALRDQALMAHSDSALKYLNEYRTYVVTYTAGRDRLEEWLKAYGPTSSLPDRRWDAFRGLIGMDGNVPHGEGRD
jgi:hypothetical protein